MFFHFELVEFFHGFDEEVEVFAGDFLDFFALAADEGVVAAFFFFYFAADVAFDAVDFVDEMDFFQDLNDAVDGDGIEVDFVLLKGDFGDLVGREGATGFCEHFDHGHAWTGDFVAGVAERCFGKFCIGHHWVALYWNYFFYAILLFVWNC